MYHTCSFWSARHDLNGSTQNPGKPALGNGPAVAEDAIRDSDSLRPVQIQKLAQGVGSSGVPSRQRYVRDDESMQLSRNRLNYR